MRRFAHKTILKPLCLLIMLCSCFVAFADQIPLQAHQTAGRTVFLEWQVGTGVTDIYRRYPGESQSVLIGSTQSNSWTDRHGRAVCCDTVYYEVHRGADSGTVEIEVCDNEPTSPAQWSVVTVDQNTQRITLKWIASQDTDIMGYMICEGSPSMAIDTVYGRENTTYTYLQDTDIYVHQFKICAFDSCHRASALTSQCNNVVVVLESEPCSRTLTATWNSYENMPSGVGRFELWASQDDAPFALVGQQAGNSDGSFVFNVSDNCQSVRVYVRIVSSDGAHIAFSNCSRVSFSPSERPAYLYLRKVSVADNGTTVLVVGETDASWSDHYYTVYRSVGDGATREVGRCRPTATGQLVWYDKEAHPDQEIHTYCFGITDSCGRNEIFSEKGSTILPSLRRQGDNGELEWNVYQGWEGTTMYSVYVSGLESDLWQLAGSTTDTRMPNIFDVTTGLSRYKVIAFEGSDSRYRHSDSVQSVQLIYSPHIDIWMSNSFTPLENSNNRIGPVSAYINPDGYSFSIYNRMGLKVFTSSVPSECWDGTYKGQLQLSGAYTYLIKYRQNDGTMQQMVGTILMIY